MTDAPDVWEALADAGRREILSSLLERDGQTVTELSESLGTSRYAVSRHLKALRSARLVTAVIEGQNRRHWLCAEPIRALHAGWMAPYVRRWEEATEATLEQPAGGEPQVVMQSHIRCSPVQLWVALTHPAATRRFLMGAAVHADWIPGGTMEFRGRDGTVMARGEVLTLSPPWELAFMWRPEGEAEGPSRVCFRVEDLRAFCRLTLTHSGFDRGNYPTVLEAWRRVLDSLKSLLETKVSLHEIRLRLSNGERAPFSVARQIEALMWREVRGARPSRAVGPEWNPAEG